MSKTYAFKVLFFIFCPTLSDDNRPAHSQGSLIVNTHTVTLWCMLRIALDYELMLFTSWVWWNERGLCVAWPQYIHKCNVVCCSLLLVICPTSIYVTGL